MLTVGRILMFLMSWHHADEHSAERHNAKTILGPYPRLSRSLLDDVEISQCMLFGDWVDFCFCGGEVWGGGGKGEGEEIDVGAGYWERDCLQNLVNRSP